MMLNLYLYHDKPHALDHYENRNLIPKFAWHKAIRTVDDDFIANNEKLWARDPDTASWYAGRTRKAFPLGEPAIAQTSFTAKNYAINVLKGPFKLGEPKLAHPRDVEDLIDLVEYISKACDYDIEWVKKLNPKQYENLLNLFKKSKS